MKLKKGEGDREKGRDGPLGDSNVRIRGGWDGDGLQLRGWDGMVTVWYTTTRGRGHDMTWNEASAEE